MSDPNGWDYHVCAYSNVQMTPIPFHLGAAIADRAQKD